MSSWFFSYGTSADPSHVATEIGPVAESIPATIPDHRLTFANYRAEWGGGTSCIVPAPGLDVIGVMHKVSDDQVALLSNADPTYALVDKTARTAAGTVDVKVLLPITIGEFAAPADSYVGKVRSGLSAYYPIDRIDAHLKQALQRDALFDSMVAQWVNESAPQREYNTLFRRLLPWRGMVRTPWGGAWATIDPGDASELYKHDEEEIAIVVAGEGELRVDSNTRPIRKGDVVYFEPYCEHVVTNTSSEALEVLFFWWGGRDGTMWAGRPI
ncbi:cupin domain-containing protein [Bradyrhizobium sp. 2TAF24]|uniref:cupin domain-containing protein n=1 Tax=Bradyrhizobium sp. 2TAF24 TaxID=3233011 RepID=UPI003F935B8F